MPPTIALFLWLVLLLALLWFDPARDAHTSPALWVPVIWMFILASRLPSQWLGGQVGSSAQAFQDGNPLDRTVFTVLILLAIGILLARSFNWGGFFTRNLALTAYIGFALMSVLWSDYSFVAFKRWFRDLGNYVVILVALSDPRPLVAVRAVLRRLCYLLIPLSVLLIKYYPYIGKQYSFWTGAAEFVGVGTSKNMLGIICLVSGLFFFWDTLTRWPERRQRRTRTILLTNAALIAMTVWLMNLASSTTSDVCLALACAVVVAARGKFFRRRPRLLKAVPPAIFCLYLILAIGFGLSGDMAGAVGKDPTLTDRTKIWTTLLSMHTNPLLGTGYESFWLGSRLEWFWQNADLGHINEAHNGYLEVYLNLGLIGLGLLITFLIASYRKICRSLERSSLASLGLALWSIMLFYSVTEAGFRSGLMWITFLMGVLPACGRLHIPVRSRTLDGQGFAADPFPRVPLETANISR